MKILIFMLQNITKLKGKPYAKQNLGKIHQLFQWNTSGKCCNIVSWVQLLCLENILFYLEDILSIFQFPSVLYKQMVSVSTAGQSIKTDILPHLHKGLCNLPLETTTTYSSGIKFHSDVFKMQSEFMRKDIRNLYC